MDEIFLKPGQAKKHSVILNLVELTESFGEIPLGEETTLLTETMVIAVNPGGKAVVLVPFGESAGVTIGSLIQACGQLIRHKNRADEPASDLVCVELEPMLPL